jgi:hypothetical protein
VKILPRLNACGSSMTGRFPGRHDDLDVVEHARQESESLERPAARRQRASGVASAMRLSWVLPAYVSLGKRIVSAALISSPCLAAFTESVDRQPWHSPNVSVGRRSLT